MTSLTYFSGAFQKRLLVVENEGLLRDLIARLLGDYGFAIKTASNAGEAKVCVGAFDPDAVILDIDLGLGPNGFHVAEVLAEENPEIGVVFLTNLPDARFAESVDMTRFSGAAFLRKGELVDATVLVRAVDAVLRDRVSHEFRHDRSVSRPLGKLSATQLTVLRLIAEGKTNSQIAEMRSTSIRAVEAVVSRVLRHLGIDPAVSGNPRVEATRVYFDTFGTTS